MRRSLAALLALAFAAAVPARAGSLVDLSIVDRDTGETLATYQRHGKTYIAGTPGHRYAIRLSNRTGGRVMTVLLVDGVNAVSGETAGTDQNGYVLGPWQSTEILGWRKSLDEIAQFNFTALPDSYAARTGRPANVGVIGVAVFTERAPVIARRDEPKLAEPIPPPPASRRMEAESGAQAPGAAADAAAPTASAEGFARESAQARARPQSLAKAERLGTGHGAREDSRVTLTSFERSSTYPAERIAVWYDSYRNLVARGIIVTRPIAWVEPTPFPNGFVADPPRR